VPSRERDEVGEPSMATVSLSRTTSANASASE
jgi:hypothetical protein